MPWGELVGVSSGRWQPRASIRVPTMSRAHRTRTTRSPSSPQATHATTGAPDDQMTGNSVESPHDLEGLDLQLLRALLETRHGRLWTQANQAQASWPEILLIVRAGN